MLSCCAAISVSHLRLTPAAKERLAAFKRLDPETRSFKTTTQDSQEVSSGSVTMSSKYLCLKIQINNEIQVKLRYLSCFGCVGAGKSTKSASKFSVTDLTTVRSSKRKAPTSPTASVPKAPLKGKGGKKRKASEAEDLQGLPLIRQQFLDYFSEVRITVPAPISC